MSCIKFHSAIFSTSLLCRRVRSFQFSIPYEFSFRIETHAYVSKAFLQSLQDSFSQLRTNHLHRNQSPEIMVLHYLWHLRFVLVEFHPLHC